MVKHTNESVAALSDIELALEMAKIAGLENARVVKGVLIYGPRNNRIHSRKTAPDYLNDLNAFDDLCKSKGYTWQKIDFDRDHDQFFVENKCVDEREGEFPRCRFLCEAFKLAYDAEQERKRNDRT